MLKKRIDLLLILNLIQGILFSQNTILSSDPAELVNPHQSSQSDFSWSGTRLDAEAFVLPVYTELRLGTVKPAGWLLHQLQITRDGTTGHLDEVYSKVKDSNGWEIRIVNINLIFLNTNYENEDNYFSFAHQCIGDFAMQKTSCYQST